MNNYTIDENGYACVNVSDVIEEGNFIIDDTCIKMEELAKIEEVIMDCYTKKIIEGIFDEHNNQT